MASHQQEENKKKELTPEEIGQYRATAQQNSLDSIRAAEERYAKAKESGHSALRETKEAVTHGVGAAKDFAVGKTKEGYHAAKDVAVKTVEKAKDYVYHDKGEEEEEEVDHKSTKEKLGEQDDDHAEEQKKNHGYEQSGSGTSDVLVGILVAVGESLMEIAQTTKEIVMGRNPERKE
ncbi:hypothetical protein IHE45_17G066400 [Dioscorea alata]|uniref:Uncharacterized protein n=1 Tax=Dioscorea alata TaxID=55571 RepID=A0ACB7UCS8_DIOAL|nr:hypothetical protein IHE45_17G066400 [Dioscorea alata]